MFNPPANLTEIPNPLRKGWSDEVREWFDSARARLASPGYLFDVVSSPSSTAGPTREIVWNAFPRKYFLQIADPQTRWARVGRLVNADLTGRRKPYYVRVPNGFVPATDILFRDQDEYCEWREEFDAAGELTRVVFTCENPEYWAFIANHDETLLVSLYEAVLGRAVKRDDLFFDRDLFTPDESGQAVNVRGTYNPANRWNTTDGIVHLSHPANSLSAEVYLAADATVVRAKANGDAVEDDGELICCAGYGGPDRSSDPTIGGRINQLVRAGLSVTIDDPVGLYIRGIAEAPFSFPNGIELADCWHVLRGNEAKKQILRVEFRPPSGVKCSDISVGGVALRWGGQLAEHIDIVIHGRAFDFGLGQPPKVPCDAHCCGHPTLAGLQVIRDIGTPCPPTSDEMLSDVVDGLEAARAMGGLDAIPDLSSVPDPYTRA
jgi:hypothetical protein